VRVADRRLGRPPWYRACETNLDFAGNNRPHAGAPRFLQDAESKSVRVKEVMEAAAERKITSSTKVVGGVGEVPVAAERCL
jgi:hypothetical protein